MISNTLGCADPQPQQLTQSGDAATLPSIRLFRALMSDLAIFQLLAPKSSLVLISFGSAST